jgi:hypothetical protein
MMSIYDRLRREKQIVAFCGKKRSGKDTAGDSIANLGYYPIGFADPIKEMCQIVFEFDDEQVYGSKKGKTDELWGFSPRWAMQTIGTELFRDKIGEDVWVKSLLARIDSSKVNKFAVTDVRFPNEVDHLQRAGAEIIYVKRPDRHPNFNPTKKKIAKLSSSGSITWNLVKKVAEIFTDFGSEYHASEISLDDHPVKDEADIINDGTIDQFRAATRKYVREWENGGLVKKRQIVASTM